jgi:hypothetical protein
VESDLLSLDFAVLNLDFVAAQYNWDIFTHTCQISVPVWHTSICNAGGNIKHDDGTLALNATRQKFTRRRKVDFRNLLVSVSKTTKLFLAGSIPHVKLDEAHVGIEFEGVHLHAKSSNVFLLKLSSDVTLHEGGLSDATIANKNELKFWDRLQRKKSINQS